RLVSDLRRLSMPHLGRMVAGFVPDILERSQLSRLPAELARLRGRMTTTQLASFDRDAYLAELSFARVLRLVGWSGDRSYPSAKEQHPTGGDLRALVRKRLDAPWAAALRHMTAAGPTDVLATMPAVIERRAELSADVGGDDDFAVAYSLSSDAPAPGRRWHAPEPFVTSEGREEFEFMTGRGAADGAVRRSTRLERWGASLVFPEAYALVDVRLESTPGMEPLHAGAPWRELVAASGAEVAAVRREFTQQVAARMADSTDADRGPEPTGESRQS